MPKSKKVTVGVEITPRKTFASALEWPGWTRAGKTPEEAVAALAAYVDRYAVVAKRAKLDFPFDSGIQIDVVEETEGNATTAFGAPDVRVQGGRAANDCAGRRSARGIVDAAWSIFDGVVAGAPAELRKGPRGGGRDRDKIVEHVVGAEWVRARARPEERRGRPARPGGRRRSPEAMLEAIRGTVGRLADRRKKWPPRYAARRVAWHALDHAWEIEDRSDPER